jgi:hypothetical protein
MKGVKHQKSRLEESYFSDTLKWTIILVSVMVSSFLIVKTSYAWVSIFLILISLISFSTKYLLEVDTIEKLITDSLQVVWINTNTRKFVFHELKGIRLDKHHHAYTANSRARTAQTEFNEYIGTLEYDRSSIELMRSLNYETFAEAMKRMAAELQIPIHRTF